MTKAPEKRGPGRPRKTVDPKKARAPRLRPDARGDEFTVARARMAKIKEYWLDRGYEIQAEVVLAPGEIDRYEVKTNLVGGMPRGYKDPARKQTHQRTVGGAIGPVFRYRDVLRDGA